MPPQTDTYARAFACCADILAELGRFPTIDLIRARIGVNSPATIKRAINDWTLQFAEDYIGKQQRPGLPPVLLQGVEQVWKQAVTEAEKAYLDKEQAYQARIQEQEVALTEERQAVKVLGEHLDTARRELERQGATIRHLDTQLAEAVQQNLAVVDALEVAAKESERLSGLLTEEKERHARQQEQDQAWFARRLLEERDFLEAKHRDEAERMKRQVATLKESETALQQSLAGLRQEQRRLEAELAKAKVVKQGVYKFRAKGRGGR